MKLLELGLVRFGPFTDVSLQLDAPGLHVIHGRNEAGKSTALRAITGLLYGIEERTPDAHLHPMDQLRLRGRVLSADGSELVFERRKGRKNTLLDPAGQPLDEAQLRRILSGIGKERFITSFGLTGARLREGGEALLRGEGDVGQSLFDAAAGGEGVRQLIAELRAQADALYSPKTNASRRSINALLKAYKESEQRARQQSMLPRAWVEQRKGLDADLARRQELDERRRQLLLDKQRLERAVRALPKLARLAEVKSALGLLSSAPRLPVNASERRATAVTRLSSASREAERQTLLLTELEAERDAHQVPEELLSLDSGLVESLASRLASHHKADGDLRKLSGELAVAKSDVSSVRARLGEGEPAAAASELTAAERARISRLSRNGAQLDAALAELQKQRQASESQHALLARQIAEMPALVDSAGLQRTLDAALGLGDVDAAHRGLETRAAELDRELRAALDRLGVSLDAERVIALPAPSQDVLDAEGRERKQLDAELGRVLERIQVNEQAELRVRRELETLEQTGHVLTEHELDLAREKRDATWSRARRAWRAAEPPEVVAEVDPDRTLDEAFELTLRAADDVGDRLRRDAERSAKLASLEAERSALAEEAERLRQKHADVLASDAAWRARFAELAPLPELARLAPSELSSWLARRATVVELAQRLAGVRQEAAELDRRRSQLRSALAHELADAVRDDGDPSLSVWVRHAKAELERRRSLADGRAHIEHDIARLAATRALAELELEQRRNAASAWRAEWGEAVAPLGLGAEAGTEEVDAVLSQRSELSRKLEVVRSLERRIDGIERDAQALEQDVVQWVARHAPDLVGRPFAEAGAELVRRHRQASMAHARRTDVEHRITRAREQLSELRLERERAEAEIAELLAQASVNSIEDLPAAEAASQRRLELEREAIEVARELDDIRMGIPLEVLEAEAAAEDLDRARVTLGELEHELEALEQERDAVLEQIAGRRAGLERLDDSAVAAEAAAEAMAHAARIRHDVERYARLRIAEVVLSRQIERYRQKNQGPLIARTGELFPRLTRGRYAGVRVDVGDRDEPVLRCVRADGHVLDVDGLSEGTRDQLYLALRLASIERHAELGVMLPLVLDDVLVHFDEPRAEAALEVLSELSARIQVLLFTHHDHVVAAAKKLVPAELLAVHTLTRPDLAPRVESEARV